ncbi:hypothetical protein N8813_03455 [bacterium]|nr:hypothetical protein [bacterium]
MNEQIIAALSRYLGVPPPAIQPCVKVDPPSDFGTPIEIVKTFGVKPAYRAAITEMEITLYPIPTTAA